MIVKTVEDWVYRMFKFIHPDKAVKLSFTNTSSERILLMRVIVSEKAYEFKNLNAGDTTAAIRLHETCSYFFTHIVTPTGNFYFLPSGTQLKEMVTHGRLKVLLCLEKDTNGKETLILLPQNY